MDKPISSLMERSVKVVDLDATVDEVETLLDANGLSSVPVIDPDGAVFGIISAPDLVHFHHLRKNAKAVRAWEVCTHKVIEVPPDMPVKDAAKLMVLKKVHHLIVRKDADFMGVVSSIDLVDKYLLDRLGTQGRFRP